MVFFRLIVTVDQIFAKMAFGSHYLTSLVMLT